MTSGSGTSYTIDQAATMWNSTMRQMLTDWGIPFFIVLTGGLLWLSGRHRRIYATIIRRFLKVVAFVCGGAFIMSVIVVTIHYTEIRAAIKAASGYSFAVNRLLNSMQWFGISAIVAIVGSVYFGIIWFVGTFLERIDDDSAD